MTETSRIGLTLAGKYRITGAPMPSPYGVRQSALDLRSDRALEVVTLAGPGNKRALLRAAHLATSVRGEGLAFLYAAETLPDGSAAIVIDPPMGLALDAWAGSAGSEKVVALFFESVRALARAHSRGLVHGAICPETLRVESGGRAVLWANGLLALSVAWYGGLRGANPAADFAAPATATTDARADVFGLAQTFLAVGLLPEQLVSVLGRAAAVDPAVRYADALDLAAALGLDLTHEPAPVAAPLPDTQARGLDLLAGFAEGPELDEDGPTVRMGRGDRERLAAVAVARIDALDDLPAEPKHEQAVALRQSALRRALETEPSHPAAPAPGAERATLLDSRPPRVATPIPERPTLMDPTPRRLPSPTSAGHQPTLRVDALSDDLDGFGAVRADRRRWLILIGAGTVVLGAILWWWRQ